MPQIVEPEVLKFSTPDSSLELLRKRVGGNPTKNIVALLGWIGEPFENLLDSGRGGNGPGFWGFASLRFLVLEGQTV